MHPTRRQRPGGAHHGGPAQREGAARGGPAVRVRPRPPAAGLGGLAGRHACAPPPAAPRARQVRQLPQSGLRLHSARQSCGIVGEVLGATAALWLPSSSAWTESARLRSTSSKFVPTQEKRVVEMTSK